MLIGFFLHLKSARLPVSTREFLTLLEALEARVVYLLKKDRLVICLIRIAARGGVYK